MREFCEFRNLLPRGLKLAEDIWERIAFVLSMKMQEPQFSGADQGAPVVTRGGGVRLGCGQDAFSLWLNAHPELGMQLAELAISNAGRRLKAGKKVERKKITQGRRCRASWPTAPGRTRCAPSCSGRRRLGRRLRQAGAGQGVSGDHAAARQDPEYRRSTAARCSPAEEVHDIAVAIGVDPGATDLAQLRYGKICILADADSDGLHIATLLCALFVQHFRPLVEAGHVYVAMPPLYRIDTGKDIFYALDEGRA